MALGMGSVGGSAAAGIQSGFEMGRQIDLDAERKAQTARANERQERLDTEHREQTARTNKRQDEADEEHRQNVALVAINEAMNEHRIQGAALAHQYGGMDKIPSDIAKAYVARAQEIGTQRASALRTRYQPQVEKEQQWAKDISSKLQAGQMSINDLSPEDKVRWIEASTGHPVTAFVRPPNGGNSQIGQAIADTTAGIQSGNGGLTVQGANTLLGPEINQGVGHVAPDGSRITGKSLYALLPAPEARPRPVQQSPLGGIATALNEATAQPAPGGAGGLGGVPTAPAAPAAPAGPAAPAAPQAPPADNGMGGAPDTPTPAAGGGLGAAPPIPDQAAPAPAAPPTPAAPPVAAAAPPQQPPLQPGPNPGLLTPVLQVETERPDGTKGIYHAPVTVGRGTGAGDQIHPGIQMSDAMDRMGRMGVLETFVNTPEMRAQIDQVVKARGNAPNTALGAYYAMHGDEKGLIPADEQDATSQTIRAVQRLAKEQGISFGDAMAQYKGYAMGGPLAKKLRDIDNSGASPEDKDTARRVALGTVKIAAPKAPGSTTDMTPEAIDQTAYAALKDRSALIGIGRDPNKVTKVLNRMAELSPGGDIAGNRALFNADKKSLDKIIPMYDAVTSFENNTVAQGKRLVELAKEVDTTGLPVIERWIRAGRKSVAGDPAVSAFDAQLTVFGNEAAKILTNPNLTGVLTVEGMREVQSFLPKSANAAQIERVVNLLGKDFETRQKSLEDQTAAITKRMASRTPAPVTGGGAGATGHGQVSPAEQAKRDSDRLPILQEELKAAQGRLANNDPRAQADIDALNKEIAALPKGARGPVTGATAPAAAPKFENGKVYQDAKGNKARFDNGTWTPL